jgi:Arc/MetJ-type ribon-helix-helix transcriptional regulator
MLAAALPLSSMPELRKLLEQYLGGDESRGNVINVRLADDALARLDELVEAGLFGSRSEAAAFLVGAGIRAQQDLLDRIAAQAAEIGRMRKGLREAALESLRRSSGPGRKKK